MEKMKKSKEIINNRKRIPLYNCYWCRCGYCKNRTKEECIDHCIRCMQKKEFKMDDYCEMFEEDTMNYNKIYKDRNCYKCTYKKKYQKIKDILENKN